MNVWRVPPVRHAKARASFADERAKRSAGATSASNFSTILSAGTPSALSDGRSKPRASAMASRSAASRALRCVLTRRFSVAFSNAT
jgi:hypothetical protein